MGMDKLIPFYIHQKAQPCAPFGVYTMNKIPVQALKGRHPSAQGAAL